jgi:hypothetical protein
MRNQNKIASVSIIHHGQYETLFPPDAKSESIPILFTTTKSNTLTLHINLAVMPLKEGVNDFLDPLHDRSLGVIEIYKSIASVVAEETNILLSNIWLVD